MLVRTNPLALLFLVLVCLTACRERREATYETLLAAQENGAIERGWVPDFLPASAFTIREYHDLDTNEIWGTFRFEPAEWHSLREHLVFLAPESGLATRSPGTDIDWWPPELAERIATEELRRQGFSLWQAREGTSSRFLFAVNPDAGLAYFWLPGS